MAKASFFLENLAAALLSGKWTKPAMLARARLACNVPSRRLPLLVRVVHGSYPARPPSLAQLLWHLRGDRVLAGIVAGMSQSVYRFYWLPSCMEPSCAAAASWPVPTIATEDGLANWLETPLARLDWLADVKNLNRSASDSRLRHYHYQWLRKRGGRFRLVEAPKPTLKSLQRRILHALLDFIPPHPAAHGFRRGRSVLSYAAPHVAKPFVVRFDLADFFPRVTASRVHAVFRTAGYPLSVARMLTGLCTTQTPEDILAGRPVAEYAAPEEGWHRPFRLRHLAQGAPTSPALANLCAFGLDVRLTALAKSWGADYTRYADDLAFSGGLKLRRFARHLQVLVAVIAEEEGFRLNFRKCKFMSASVRQELAGTPVIYYSPSSEQVEGPAVMHQGLPIGDGVEGFFANIFLKDVDDAMAAADATYGRYVDDIRIFGQNRDEVLHRLRILQEQLLRKGLNLNSSKTKIAENPQQLQDLISQNYGLAEYREDEPPRAGLEVQSHIDQPFEAFSRTFSKDQELKNCGDAKDFCKYLSSNDLDGNPMLPIAARQPWHVDRLREAVVHWRGSTKHAGWLLVQTAVYRGIPASAQRGALETVLELLESNTAGTYSRYRMLHHLLKMRQTQNGSTFRFLDSLNRGARQRVLALIPALLGASAFELNLIALYMASISGNPVSQLRSLVSRHTTRGCEPVRNALSLLGDGPSEAIFVGAADSEPDEVPNLY